MCRYNGFYKGVQSAGAAVAWQIDVHNVSFVSELAVSWALCTISYPLLVILIILAVKDESVEDLEGTSKEVALPAAVPESMEDSNVGVSKSD